MVQLPPADDGGPAQLVALPAGGCLGLPVPLVVSAVGSRAAEPEALDAPTEHFEVVSIRNRGAS